MPHADFTFEAENGTSFTTDEHGFVKGEVLMDASDLISSDLEGALDLFSTKLTGSDLLLDVSYKPVRIDGESIVFEVSGGVTMILQSLGLVDADDDESSPTP